MRPHSDEWSGESGSSAGEAGRQPARQARPRPFLAALPGLASIPMARSPRFFPALSAVMLAGVILLLAGAMLFAQHSAPSAIQRELARWAETCRTAGAFDPAVESRILGGTPVAGRPPGLGTYLATDELRTFGALSVGGSLLSFGDPLAAGCPDYGLVRRQPVIWMRLIFAGGQIEASAMLPYSAERLSADTPIHTLRCYAPGEDYALQRSAEWHGFTSLASYECPTSHSVTPGAP